MKEQLKDRYCRIAKDWNVSIEDDCANSELNNKIKIVLETFVSSCNNPAIWCYGKHTKMLMADFIYELKAVKYIIDEASVDDIESGFKIIGKEEIEESNIDGIIISSFRYKEEIKEVINARYPEIKYLDIYDALKLEGMTCSSEYYNQAHPYEKYKNINFLQRKLAQCDHDVDRCGLYEKIIKSYVQIKDFLSSIGYMKEYVQLDFSENNQKRLSDLYDIYNLQLKAATNISQSNVLMLCIDALRRKDILNGLMPKLTAYISENMMWFENAYSVSTSTFESLIPAYSENVDMRTRYFDSGVIEEENCRFLKKAIEQNRKVFFYTDACPYVNSPSIKVTNRMQTVSEKMWDFIMDAVDEENALLYVHVLYESHFSYANPYTKRELVAEGTNILFDCIARNGGELRTDYDMQHMDALRYLDDIITPFINVLDVNMVLYADHGSVIFDSKDELSKISYSVFAFGEDLIRIPIGIKKHQQTAEKISTLMSLSEINNIVISLLEDKAYRLDYKPYVKVQRSELYNPDFKYLYKKANFERGLLAYEMYVFESGYKLVIYSDGLRELYNINDEQIWDDTKINELYQVINEEITVTEI